MQLSPAQILALFAQGFIVIGTDPADPRIDVGVSDKSYNIAGSRFRVTLNGDDVILMDASKHQAFVPFIPYTREVGDGGSRVITSRDACISFKRSDSILEFDSPDTFSTGQPLEIFNLTSGAVQLVGVTNAFLDGSLSSTLILSGYKSIRLSVQDVPGVGKVFMVA